MAVLLISPMLQFINCVRGVHKHARYHQLPLEIKYARLYLIYYQIGSAT